MTKLSQMFINPVLNKEIKLRFRSFKSFLGIFFYLAVLGAVALGFIFMQTQFGGGFFRPEQSRTLFMVLSMGQLALIIFMTPGLTAGVISGERERQTLNILLSTGQSSLSIILSKLVSSIAFLFLMVIGSLPLYSIVFLYGGVSPNMVMLTFLVYIITMLGIGSIGIMISTLIRRTIVSIITTYGITLMLMVGVVLVYIFFQSVFLSYNHQTGIQQQSYVPYFLLMVNAPAVLMSTFEPGIERDILRVSKITAPLLYGFIITYLGLTIFALTVSIKKLRPSMRKGRR
jgi:ABC-2 type transport system permease protein